MSINLNISYPDMAVVIDSLRKCEHHELAEAFDEYLEFERPHSPTPPSPPTSPPRKTPRLPISGAQGIKIYDPIRVALKRNQQHTVWSDYKYVTRISKESDGGYMYEIGNAWYPRGMLQTRLEEKVEYEKEQERSLRKKSEYLNTRRKFRSIGDMYRVKSVYEK